MSIGVYMNFSYIIMILSLNNYYHLVNFVFLYWSYLGVASRCCVVYWTLDLLSPLTSTTDPCLPRWYQIIFNFHTIFHLQIYDNGKARIKETLQREAPIYASLCLDSWSIHHHGYEGAISSM